MVPKSAAAANSAPSSPVTANPAAFYITGGTLPPEASSYVTRQADTDLLAALLAGEYCYVLNSRQMGKSSLCVRTMGALQAAGVRTVFVDLTKLGGSNINAEQWYAGLLAVMGRELGLRSEFLAYWKAQAAQGVGPLPRLFGALEEIALAATDTPVVVFIDEIDATRSLPFAVDEFFIAIRQAYVERAVNPTMKRLTFCLLGTAAPSDLIADTRLSPFNIGRRVEVSDFTPTEAAPLAAGLGANGGALLARVLYWTNGHPYLTQRLCSAIVDAQHPAPDAPHPTVSVDKLCTGLFLTHTARESDNNLTFVRDRLLKSEMDLSALMDMYARIREGGRVADDDTNPLCATLKLAGVARVENGLLHVRNRIYTQVFDRRWVTDHTSPAELRRQQAAYRRGVQRALALAGVIVAVFSGVLAFALQQRNDARQNARIANAKTLETTRALENAADNLYVANMNLIQREWENDNFAHVQELLKETSTYQARGFEWGYWNRLCHLSLKNLKTLAGHTGSVHSVAFSSDGKRLVTGSGDSTAKVWDVQTGAILLTLKGHTKDVHSVAFSPDDARIVTGSDDKTAKVWDARTGHELLSLKGNTNGVRSVTYSSVRENRLARNTFGASGLVASVAFSPDGKRIFTGSDDGTAKIWDARTGREALTLKGPTIGVLSAAFSPDGAAIVTDGRDTLPKVWDTRTGKLLLTCRIGLGNFPDGMITYAVAFSPDGRRIAANGEDNTAKILDARTGRELLTLKGHRSDVNSVAFSRDGKRLVTGSIDQTVKVWDAQTGNLLMTLKGHTAPVNSVAFSPDGAKVVTGGDDKIVKVWNAQTESPQLAFKGHTDFVNSAAFLTDGKRILTRSNGNAAKLWDTAIGLEAMTLIGRKNWDVSAAALSADGNRIVTAGTRSFSANDAVKIWDAWTGKLLITLKGNASTIHSVSFSLDSAKIVATSSDHTAKVWNAQTGELLLTLKGHTDAVFSAAFSPDGKRIVTGSLDDTAKVWDAQTGHELLTLKADSRVFSVMFSPDGAKIVTGGEDKTAKIWDTATGHELLVLKGHTDSVASAAFYPDGMRIVTGSVDGTAKVWNAQTGRELLTLKVGTLVHDYVYNICVAFSPDGKRLVANSNDVTAIVWFSDMNTKLP